VGWQAWLVVRLGLELSPTTAAWRFVLAGEVQLKLHSCTLVDCPLVIPLSLVQVLSPHPYVLVTYLYGIKPRMYLLVDVM
jgi:hypothetical protein